MFVIFLLIIILTYAIDFALISFVVWLGSLLFHYEFSWLLVVFISFVLFIFQSIFNRNSN